MPFQNRVSPDGRIVAHTARGLFTGNRGGPIHEPGTGRIRPRRQAWSNKRWITCVTAFRGRKRTVMGPGYTHLFFLDEVTAFAAGHRPCFECRRQDATAFAASWRDVNGREASPSADAMDVDLHASRHAVTGTFAVMDISNLPDGTIIVDPDGSGFLAVLGDALTPWSFTGYGPFRARPTSGNVQVVTPAPILSVLRHGYRPEWHETAKRP